LMLLHGLTSLIPFTISITRSKVFQTSIRLENVNLLL
jgi:hypothetical protein